MELKRRFSFSLTTAKGEGEALLFAPERIFARLPGIKNLQREGERLTGALCGEAPFFGEVCFPFESRLFQNGNGQARLVPITLAGERFWAELAGDGVLNKNELRYQVELTLHAELPSGEKWGGRAFRRMVEAALARHLGRALDALPKKLEFE